jgi:multidrug efflux pump subunit AcrA (membrane-fusion protein)
MNDLEIPDRNDAISRGRQDNPAVDREIKSPAKHHPQARHRWGGRLFALGGFLLLAGGLSVGVWGKYSQQQQVTATAEQRHDFVPSVDVARVKASPATTPIILPGTTAAFAVANIFARATGYIAKRNVDIGDHVRAGELLAQLSVPELDDQISQNEATRDHLKSMLAQAEATERLRQVTWGPGRTLGRKRLGYPPARRRGLAEPEGAAGRSCRRET